jgi:hypothetical protein
MIDFAHNAGVDYASAAPVGPVYRVRGGSPPTRKLLVDQQQRELLTKT